MDKTFDIYKGDNVLISGVAGTVVNGKTIVTITGLTPSTTYNNLSIAYAGQSNRTDIPQFTTTAAGSATVPTVTETQTQTVAPTVTETQTQTQKPA